MGSLSRTKGAAGERELAALLSELSGRDVRRRVRQHAGDSDLLGLDQSVFSALGLVAVLAGSTNTPIASTVLAMELFGSAVAPFAGIACAVSYVITGHRSLYPGQLMLRPKARTFVSRKNADGDSEIVSRFDGVSIGRLINFHIKEAKKRIIDRRKLKIGGK